MKLQVGDSVVSTDGSIREVVSPRPINGAIKVCNHATMQEEYLNVSRLVDRMATGEFEHRSKTNPPPLPPVTRTATDQAEYDKTMNVVARINAIAAENGTSTRAAMKTLRKEIPNLPAQSTIYRHVYNVRQGQDPVKPSLTKGNRTRRHSQEITDLIVSLANEHYLKPKSRFTLHSLTKLVNTNAQQKGIAKSSQKISTRYVKRTVDDEITHDPAAERMDQKTRNSKRSTASLELRVNTPFQRLEQDTLHIPVVARTKWGNTNELYLTAAIDCSISIVAGWNFSIGSPAESATLKCIERIIYPKADQLSTLGIAIEQDLHGAPPRIFTDGGPENKGPRIRGLTKLGINAILGVSGKPSERPFIERLFGSLKPALETLPGSTRLNGEDGKRDPIALRDPLLSVEDVQKWILRWLFEKWPHTVLERLIDAEFRDDFVGSTPAAAFEVRINQQQATLPLPPNLYDWRLNNYERHTKKLSRTTGVSVYGFKFGGENLKRALEIFGENFVTVLVDPEDFRRVFILFPGERKLLELRNKRIDDSTPAYSFDEAKRIRKYRTTTSSHPQAERFDQDLAAASTTPKKKRTSTRKKSTKAESAATKAAAKQAGAESRAAQQPLQEDKVDSGPSASSKANSRGACSNATFSSHDTRTGREIP